MEKLGSLIYGNEYQLKKDLFEKIRIEINEKYEIDFNYCTLQTHSNGKIELIFDVENNIPIEMKKELKDSFKSIFSV